MLFGERGEYMPSTLPVQMETAKESGNPFFIELYVLELRNGITRIAACDEDIVYNGEKYIAVPFKRGEITKSMDNITDSCEVTLGDCSYELLSYVIQGFDFRGCNATVARISYPESLSDPSIIQLVFSGYIDEPSYSDGQFVCKVKSRIPDIECPNRDFRLACNSEFGDAECGMDLAIEKVGISGANGNKITVQGSWPSNYWRNGVASVEGESRVIHKSEGNTITLNVNFAQDVRGMVVTLQKGCDKSADMCRKYNNMKHFSGFPSIPLETQYR